MMNRLTIAGIGAFPSHLTADAKEAVENSFPLLQTRRCYLGSELPHAADCDDLYEEAYDYDELNQLIADRAVKLALQKDTVFLMPSTPVGKELCRTVRREAEAAGLTCRILPSVSYADAALCAAGLCFDTPPRVTDACGIEQQAIDVNLPLVVAEVDNRLLAGNVKLALMEYYPDDREITLAVADARGYTCRRLPLEELDRLSDDHYAHTTCVILAPVKFEELQRRGVAELDYLVKRLRAPGGCPWDREQTIKSLRATLLEEAYEVAEAIDEEDPSMLCEELGDLLLQIVFLARISDEHAEFTLRDVATDICAKLVYRHPHVFGEATANNSAEVLTAWEKLKKAEKQQSTQTQVLRSVPKPLPALTRSAKVQKKAANVGFDWNDPLDALKKVREETGEFEQELAAHDPQAAFEEMGDLLFAVVNTARLSGIDPELALNRATEKFTDRFERMEKEMLRRGMTFEDSTLEQMDCIWDEIKHLQD